MNREQSEELYRQKFIDFGLSEHFEFLKRDWTSDHGRKAFVKCKKCGCAFDTWTVKEIFAGKALKMFCPECGAASDGSIRFTHTEEAKQAVELYLQGLEQTEIAKQLGCTVNDVGNTVKLYGVTDKTRKYRASKQANQKRINETSKNVSENLTIRGWELLEDWRGRRFSYSVREVSTGKVFTRTGHTLLMRKRIRKEDRITKYNAFVDKGINIEKLIQRDGSKCYLCGKETNFSDDRWGWYGPDYPTIDHVIPLSKGGKHSWNNVKVCCGRCNVKKGCKIEI